jgi:hypothetical protein
MIDIIMHKNDVHEAKSSSAREKKKRSQDGFKRKNNTHNDGNKNSNFRLKNQNDNLYMNYISDQKKLPQQRKSTQ